MNHQFKTKVYYSDTDAYRVVWHGAYLRWLEAGRVCLAEKAGHTLVELEDKDIVLPVAEINLKYKQSAKLNDIVTINTEVSEYSRCSVTFYQTVKDENNDKTYIEALVKVVAVNKEGKLYRSLPAEIMDMVN